MLGLLGFLISVLLQIYYRISERKNFENRLKFDKDISMSVMSPFLLNTVYNVVVVIVVNI